MAGLSVAGAVPRDAGRTGLPNRLPRLFLRAMDGIIPSRFDPVPAQRVTPSDKKMARDHCGCRAVDHPEKDPLLGAAFHLDLQLHVHLEAVLVAEIHAEISPVEGCRGVG